MERRGLPRRPGVYAEGNDPIYIEDFNVNSQPNTLADIVRRELSECGLSQRAAARELGIDERIMRRYCSGDLEPPAYVLLAMQQLVQVELNRQVIQMLDDGSMSTSDGNATRERFANNNETLLQAMRFLMRNDRTHPDHSTGLTQVEPGDVIEDRDGNQGVVQTMLDMPGPPRCTCVVKVWINSSQTNFQQRENVQFILPMCKLVSRGKDGGVSTL